MEENIINSVMVSELAIRAPALSALFLFNLICTLLVVGYCLFRFLQSDYVLTRLSFCFVAFFCVFYQIPLVLFSQQVEVSLRQPWAYALVVNAGALLLVIWGFLSRRLDFNHGVASYPAGQVRIYLATFALGVICLVVYLARVPWSCTGLFALLYDPWLTLLAREFSVKLIGSALSSYLLGAYANAVAPILILLSVWLIRNSLLRRQPLGFIVGILGGFFAISALLISGTKGLLMPSILMLVAGCYFWCTTWWSRAVTILLAVAFVVVALVSFEMMKERGAVVGGSYDFAACSVEAKTCQESHMLLESMKARDYSLGLPGRFVQPLQDRLGCLCGGSDKAACPSSVLTDTRNFVLDNTSIGVQHRSLSYVRAIFNRVFVVPFQVSVWSFMYAETEQVEGFKTLPLVRRIFGESLNMPELVYQKYGSVYSGGDKTSTSTAPTSFFLAYPAYLGLSGFLLALGLVIVLDLFLARFAEFAGVSLVPMLVGGIFIMCMNFMTSDFITVLSSHGGAAGVFVLFVHSLLLKRNS